MTEAPKPLFQTTLKFDCFPNAVHIFKGEVVI